MQVFMCLDSHKEDQGWMAEMRTDEDIESGMLFFYSYDFVKQYMIWFRHEVRLNPNPWDVNIQIYKVWTLYVVWSMLVLVVLKTVLIHTI